MDCNNSNQTIYHSGYSIYIADAGNCTSVLLDVPIVHTVSLPSSLSIPLVNQCFSEIPQVPHCSSFVFPQNFSSGHSL